jgi:hypothetical protein
VATKTGPFPNQHDILHVHYPNDCCLCKAEARVVELETKLKIIGKFMNRLKDMKSMPPEFMEVLNNDFWELI